MNWLDTKESVSVYKKIMKKNIKYDEKIRLWEQELKIHGVVEKEVF